jgi:lipopolysaccharide transport system ATP-binding protein
LTLLEIDSLILSMPKPIIEVKSVSKRYRLGVIGATRLRDDVERFWYRITGRAGPADEKEFWALRDVSFEVQPGEIVGIIGRNGAGKSTLLKILSRITDPTSGEIIMRGRVASLLEVGTGFHGDLTGRENIFLNGAILGMSKSEIRGKLDEIIAFAEMERFIDTPVKRYSSGMYVRLAFAVAAHLEPEILIVDEVLAVGDAEFQKKCLGKMQDVGGDGRTILFVSHNMTAVRRLCQKCLVLSSGCASPILTTHEAIYEYNIAASRERSDIMRVSDYKRDGNHGRIGRILELRLPHGSLVYGRPARIEVIFKLEQSVSQLAVGIGLDTLEGQRTLTLDSDTANSAFDVASGIHTVKFGLDFWPVHPGCYACSAALIVGHNYIDIVPHAGILEVLTDKHDVVTDRGYGAVRPSPIVEIFTSNSGV